MDYIPRGQADHFTVRTIAILWLLHEAGIPLWLWTVYVVLSVMDVIFYWMKAGENHK